VIDRSGPLYFIDKQAAALALGLELHVVSASSERDFDGVFEKLIQLQVGGLVVGGSATALTLRHKVPAVYEGHDWVTAGGLMSYGGNPESRDGYASGHFITSSYSLLVTRTGMSRPRSAAAMSAFAVAIGGKADMAYCSAYVCL